MKYLIASLFALFLTMAPTSACPPVSLGGYSTQSFSQSFSYDPGVAFTPAPLLLPRAFGYSAGFNGVGVGCGVGYGAGFRGVNYGAGLGYGGIDLSIQRDFGFRGPVVGINGAAGTVTIRRGLFGLRQNILFGREAIKINH